MRFVLLILSLPTENGTVRMRAWRALKACGAAVLRDGVYLLPEQANGRVTLDAIAADVRVGGGISTARAFLRAGLVDDLHVMTAPVVLGRGVRLWDDLRGLEATHELTTEVAESGTIHVTFSR